MKWLLAVTAVVGIWAAPMLAHAVSADNVRGCVIRFDSNGPFILENSTHICDYADAVSLEADGDIFVDLAVGSAVRGLVVDEDETLSRYVSCGGSGGSGTLTIRCWRISDGSFVPGDDPILQGTTKNLWLIGVNGT